MSKALIIRGADFTTNALDHVTFDVIHATGIELSDSSVSFTAIGETKRLTYTVEPSDTEDVVQFISSDTDVATVTPSGLINVVGCGACTITAMAGSVFATCTVSVQVELTGYSRFKRTYVTAANGLLDVGGTVLGTDNQSYAGELTCCVPEMPYNHLMCYDYFTKQVDGEWVLADRSDLSGGHLRFYDQIGYPTPVVLPKNTKKIRFISPDALHGVYPMIFKHDVPAAAPGERGCFTPWREEMAPRDTYSYVYATSNDVIVPDGYDSVIFVWKADTANDGKLFTEMTDEEIAQFKAICM